MPRELLPLFLITAVLSSSDTLSIGSLTANLKSAEGVKAQTLSSVRDLVLKAPETPIDI